MSDTRFTPGPWRIAETMCHEIGIYAFDGPLCLATAKNEANAHLIAAAPALYEALDELAEAVADEANAEFGISGRVGARLSDAREALSQALGDQK